MNLIRVWERFWFEPVPLVSYAVLRAVFGVVGIVNLLSYTPVSMFWPVDAIAPIPGAGVGLRVWVQEAGLGTAFGTAYFAVLLAAFVALATGFFTRWAVLACFIGSVGQKYWNHLPLTSSVEVITVVLFCLLFVDSGRVMSVDAWLARRRGRSPDPLTLTEPIWPMRLIRFQVALMYLNSGLWKLFGATWRDGTTLHYVMNHNIFHRFPFAIPPAAEGALTLGTYLTLAWEIGFAFMLLNRWTRRVALMGGVCVHLGIWFGMEVGSFSWVTLATYVAFLDPHGLARRLAGFTSLPVSTALATEALGSVARPREESAR
jgi:hypothetical protein